jgi:hypothetical protein
MYWPGAPKAEKRKAGTQGRINTGSRRGIRIRNKRKRRIN